MHGCIEWSKSKTLGGYGKFKRNGVTYLAHRQAYVDAHGLQYTDIKGKVVLHACDNPSCVNPAHLSLGTQSDNIADMVAKERQVKGSACHTSKLTAEQVATIRATFIPRSKTHGSVALGKQYGVSHRAILYIISGQNW